MQPDQDTGDVVGADAADPTPAPVEPGSVSHVEPDPSAIPHDADVSRETSGEGT